MRGEKFLVTVIWALLVVAPSTSTYLEASPAAQEKEKPDQNVGNLRAVTVTFGIRDPKPTVWDGSVDLSAGAIERIVGYHFTETSST